MSRVLKLWAGEKKIINTKLKSVHWEPELMNQLKGNNKKNPHIRTHEAILSKRRNALGKNGNSSGNDLLPEPFKIQTKGAEYTHSLTEHNDSP